MKVYAASKFSTWDGLFCYGASRLSVLHRPTSTDARLMVHSDFIAVRQTTSASANTSLSPCNFALCKKNVRTTRVTTQRLASADANDESLNVSLCVATLFTHTNIRKVQSCWERLASTDIGRCTAIKSESTIVFLELVMWMRLHK